MDLLDPIKVLNLKFICKECAKIAMSSNSHTIEESVSSLLQSNKYGTAFTSFAIR